MFDPFVPIEPQKEWPNKIRDFVGTIIIVGFLVFLFASPVVGRSLDFVETSLFLVGDKKISNSIQNEGGDISIDYKVPEPKLPELIVEEVIDANEFTASNLIVKDVETGTVLYGKNEYEKHSLASITKLMSALVLLDQDIDWTTTTVVLNDDLFDSHILSGEVYSVDELWDIALVGSSNKAVSTLVNLVGGQEDFVQKMNKKAKELGMSDSNFVEPTGLDSENVATASDVTILLNEALSKEKIKNSLVKAEVNIVSHNLGKKHHAWNTDWLLLNWIPHSFEEVVGGKTGYIPQSGYNFTVRVVGKNKQAINVSVLGAANSEARFTEARDIANWVFENYKWPEEEIEVEESNES